MSHIIPYGNTIFLAIMALRELAAIVARWDVESRWRLVLVNPVVAAYLILLALMLLPDGGAK